MTDDRRPVLRRDRRAAASSEMPSPGQGNTQGAQRRPHRTGHAPGGARRTKGMPAAAFGGAARARSAHGKAAALLHECGWCRGCRRGALLPPAGLMPAVGLPDRRRALSPALGGPAQASGPAGFARPHMRGLGTGGKPVPSVSYQRHESLPRAEAAHAARRKPASQASRRFAPGLRGHEKTIPPAFRLTRYEPWLRAQPPRRPRAQIPFASPMTGHRHGSAVSVVGPGTISSTTGRIAFSSRVQ